MRSSTRPIRWTLAKWNNWQHYDILSGRSLGLGL